MVSGMKHSLSCHRSSDKTNNANSFLYLQRMSLRVDRRIFSARFVSDQDKLMFGAPVLSKIRSLNVNIKASLINSALCRIKPEIPFKPFGSFAFSVQGFQREECATCPVCSRGRGTQLSAHMQPKSLSQISSYRRCRWAVKIIFTTALGAAADKRGEEMKRIACVKL